VPLSRFALVLLLAACSESQPPGDDPRSDPRDAPRVALGQKVYLQHCASCHGTKLEGQPNWKQRLPNDRLPAPPHDDSGHTWHHSDHVLSGIVKNGMVPPYAPRGYQSDMPAFGDKLSDEEIWAVLAFIKSHWSREVREMRAEMTRNASGR
jgi:mono/diheme cytochrome c family protein